MTKKDARRHALLQKLKAHLLNTGLAETSLRQLAAAADTSDRMLLYYFSDKSQLLEAVLSGIAGDLMVALAEELPEGQSLPPAKLLQQTSKLTRGNEMGPQMRLFVECVGAAAHGQAPFATLVPQIMRGFLAWIESHLDVDDPRERQAMAAMILALIDGAALLEMSTDAALGDLAVGVAGRTLGYVSR